MTGVVVKGA